jgi:hypothetical protein
MEQRIERLEDRVDKLEEEVKKQGKDFAVTEVYVKEIYKKMDSIATVLESMKAKSNTRMERFIDKLIWVMLGIVGTYIATKLNLK